MSPAMNATKRKFNALLNGMGSKSSTSISLKETNNSDLTAADTDLQAKKRRMAPSNSISTLKQTELGHKKSASIASPALSEEPPKYAPWDRAAFLKRLRSFSNLMDWTAKPAKANEVEWAKRGWVCQKQERVRCCLCNVEIVVKLNRKEVDGEEETVYIAANIEDALVEKYVELIITSHEEDCLWRKRGCDDSIFKLPLSHTPTTLQDLRTRYDALCLRKDHLPYPLNLKLPPGFDLDQILMYLPLNFFAPHPTEITSTETPRPSVNTVAFQMALFGWEGHQHERLGNQLGMVSCHACFRILGLWIFKSKRVSDAGEEVEGAAMNSLDLVCEHRAYCPWQNAASQNGSSKMSTAGMAGWEIVLRMLMNDHHLRHSGNRQKEKPRTILPEDLDEAGGGFEADSEDEDARNLREEDDKKRWARLRRVKSLFDSQPGKKLKSKSKPDL